MPRLDQRGSSALLYVVAVVMIGGFMWWLYMQTQTMETDVQPTTQDTAATQQTLTLDMVAANPDSAIGSRAVLDSVSIATGLGRGVFLVQMDSVRTLPVLKNPTLIQEGDQLYGGDVVTVAGQVYTYTDSIAQTWVQRGAVNKAQSGSLPGDSITSAFLLADSLVLH